MSEWERRSIREVLTAQWGADLAGNAQASDYQTRTMKDKSRVDKVLFCFFNLLNIKWAKIFMPLDEKEMHFFTTTALTLHQNNQTTIHQVKERENAEI